MRGNNQLHRIRMLHFLLVEGVEHVVIEVRHRVRVALVHSVIETDKFLKFSLCGDFLDCNSHISYL